MKFRLNLAHLCALSAVLSSIAVVKGASFGDALVIIAVQLPFLAQKFFESRKLQETTPEIKALELDLRKQQLQINLDNAKHQHLKELVRREAENSVNSNQKQYIF